MGWSDGNTKVIDTTPKDIKPLRAGAIDFLMGGNGMGGAGGNPSGQNNQNTGTHHPRGGTDLVGNNAPVLKGPETRPDGLDQRAIDADPAGYEAWRKQAAAAGYNYGPQQPGSIPDQGPYGVLPISQAAPGGTGGPFDRILAPTNFANFDPRVQYAGNAAPVTAGMADIINTPDRGQVRDTNYQGGDMLQMLFQNMMNPGGGSTPLGHLSTQSVTDLGSANSPFFQNMIAQYQPAFTQARADALAQAKEAMGNLTGSGAGNALGAAMNRSLGQEQATLAELAKWGIGQEIGRQTQMAGINTTRDVSSMQDATNRMGQNISGGVNLLGQDLQSQAYNQAADQGFLDLAAKIGMANQGEQGRALGQQGQMDLAQSLQNQNLLQQVLSQSSAQGVDMSKFNAGQANAMGGQNAQNFLNMLMGMLGQNNSAVQQDPGIFQSLLQTGAAIAPYAIAACWVADELYGPASVKTLRARRYVLRTNNWFTRLYKKHGKRWAAWLKRHPWAKPLVAPVWNYMAKKGA